MKSNMGISCFFLSLSLLSVVPVSTSKYASSALNEGSSLSVDNPEDLLISAGGVFSAGFYPIGSNAYCFAIWFSKPSCRYNCTIVWMANRDFPVNGRRSKLMLQATGNLILTDAGKSIAWSTSTVSQSPTQLHLQDTGNLVLKNTEGSVLWQSFDFPTDTLLPLQPLTRDTQLVSSRSQTNRSSGFYALFFNDDNSLVLLYDGPETSSKYWPTPWLSTTAAGRFKYNSTRIASLDSLGKFNSSDNFNFLAADYGVRLQRRLTLDFDGMLRLYSREEGSASWTLSWQVLSDACRVHGSCGPNSTCSYDNSSGRRCSCLPAYKMKNNTDWAYGCEPKFDLPCGNDSEASFLQLTNSEFYGYDFGYYPNYTLEKCKQLCLQSCSCEGFQLYFDQSQANIGPTCFLKSLLLNGRRVPDFNGDIYLKVSKTGFMSGNKEIVSELGLNCSGEISSPLDREYPKRHQNGTLMFMLWFAGALGLVEIIGILLAWCFLINSHKHSSEAEAAQGYHLAATGFKRFAYTELKNATKNFSEEIGRGAGGIVYKGILSDDRVVAIKRLHAASHGEAEFLAEARTIGLVNHMNLIEMWGYCAEGKHRLLVYRYMEHGSLAKNLSSKALDWRKRFEIALGTARGLAYLHEECLEWVLHCDVKPENILLDSDYQPKVSDFGLSKLQDRGNLRNSSFSRIRGTRGYMAPEWVFNLPITSKVDVYSYGIVIMEMMTGKGPLRGVDATESSGQMEPKTLVTWVRDKKNTANDNASWIAEIIDPSLEGEYDHDKMENLVSTALQCVEEDGHARPTMSKVVEMLLLHESAQ